jgi:hypothetical protein
MFAALLGRDGLGELLRGGVLFLGVPERGESHSPAARRWGREPSLEQIVAALEQARPEIVVPVDERLGASQSARRRSLRRCRAAR